MWFWAEETPLLTEEIGSIFRRNGYKWGNNREKWGRNSKISLFTKNAERIARLSV